MLTIKCCAKECDSNANINLNLKFFDLTTTKASLTEWLVAINRLDVLADLTAGESVSSCKICELHFPNSKQTSPDPSDEGLEGHSADDANSISCQSKLSQTPTTLKNYKIYTLTRSPVEIVDIQPKPQAPQEIYSSNVTKINTEIIPPLMPGLVSRMPLLDTIGKHFTNTNPIRKTNIENVPTFVAPRKNILQLNKGQIKIGIPKLTPISVAPPSVNAPQHVPQRHVTGINNQLTRVHVISTTNGELTNCPLFLYKPDLMSNNLIMNNPRPTTNANPTQATAVNKHMSAEKVTMVRLGYCTDYAQINDQKVINNMNFTQPIVDNIQCPNLMALTHPLKNELLKSTPFNNEIKIEAVDYKSEKAVEEVSNDTLTESIANFANIKSFIAEDTASKTSTDANQDTLETDTVRLQFPASEHNYVLPKEENEEHYVKFEVEESEDNNLETYCFLDDDHSAKRRKVEMMGGDFKIIKLEMDTDHDYT